MKLLLREVGTDQTRDLVRNSSGRLFASELQRLEMRSAAVRRHSIGNLTDEALRRTLAAVDGVLSLFTLVPVTSELLTRGISLIPSARLRTLDTVQLASALLIADQSVTPLTFVAADKPLLQVANASGLLTLNPGDLP